MLELLWPFALALLPLPWLIRKLLRWSVFIPQDPQARSFHSVF